MASRFSALGAAFAAGLVLGASAAQSQTLRVFVGGQQRPDVMRQILDRYSAQNPGIRVEIEVGGATSEAQQQYLTTVLTSRDPSLDVVLIDIIRPAQYAAAGWAEPLDSWLGAERDALLKRYLPAYAEANQVGGKLVALPAFADAMFLYYRKDLLDKYGLQPPKTWGELKAAAQKVLDGEKNPQLQGLSFQGAAIEGAVCTFLVPYWSAGASLTDASGKVKVDREAGARSFGLWLDAIKSGISKPAIAQVATDDTRKEFQAGNVVFAVLWGYGWNRFQADGDSAVKGKVGVVPLPALEGGKPATCIGGWQWAVSAFSSHKEQAVKLVRYLAGPETSEFLAVNASNLPALGEVYKDPDVLKANPWFADALPVVETARARPQSPRYPEVSDAIRTNVNAVLAGVKQPGPALDEIEARLARSLR